MTAGAYWFEKRFETPRELIEYFLWDSWFKTTSKFDANRTGSGGMIFRGQSDAEWSLLPKAFRPRLLEDFTPQAPFAGTIGNPWGVHECLGMHLHAEARSIYIFLETADDLGIPTPIDFSRSKEGLDLVLAALNRKLEYDYKQEFPKPSFIRATALAQHYGVPTRLLDWTESPLIAAFFAAYGASSFAGNPPRKDQDLAIYFTSTNSVTDPKRPAELVKAPRFENPNLRQQQGVFTNIRHANSFFLEHQRWPSYEDISSGDFQIHRALLRVALADELLRLLFDLGITRQSMMPSLDMAAKAYQYTRVLFEVSDAKGYADC